MTFNKLLAASVCLVMGLGVAAGAFADQHEAKTVDPSYRGTVNVDVIDTNESNFRNRIQSELVERPAPQIGQTRAAIEAVYGPTQTALAPNKNYDVYTNEFDLTDGKMFRRTLNQRALRVYEVTYNTTGDQRTGNDKAVDVKLRVIPRVGDHKNMMTKLLGEPIQTFPNKEGQHAIFGIPKERFVFYNDVLASPYEAVNAYFNADGFMVGQEFMPVGYRGWTTLTSAGRSVEFESDRQPDTKWSW